MGVWIRFGIVALAAGAWFAPFPASWIDRAFFDLTYSYLQPRLTALSDLVPWAVTDLMLAMWIGWAGWWAWRVVGALRPPRSGHALVKRLGGLVVAAAVLGLWFLLAWGGNYRRTPLADRLDFAVARVTPDAAIAIAERAAAELNALHADAHRTGWPDWEPMADELRAAAGRTWARLGAPSRLRPGHPKRSIVARGFSLAGISGFTSPLALEVVPDWQAPVVVRPDILAHEWAHLAGYADEAEAGFVGWLTGLDGPVWARYSAWLTLWPRLALGLPAGARARILATIGEGPRADWRAIVRYRSRELPIVRNASWRLYDTFLRVNRVDAGVASYGGMVRLVLGTRYRQGSWHPVTRR